MELSFKCTYFIHYFADAVYANTSPQTIQVGVTVINPAYQQPPDRINTAKTGEPDSSLEIGETLLQTPNVCPKQQH